MEMPGVKTDHLKSVGNTMNTHHTMKRRLIKSTPTPDSLKKRPLIVQTPPSAELIYIIHCGSRGGANQRSLMIDKSMHLDEKCDW